MLKALLKFFIGGEENSAEASISCRATGGIGDLEKFVEFVVGSLVDAPSEVKLATEEVGDGYVIRIRCRKDDIGKIVGKRGKTIMAIRALVSGAAGRLRKHVSVEVLD